MESGEEVVITRHGKPAAVVVRPDLLRARRAGPVVEVAEELHRQLTAARETPQPASGLSAARADELVAEVRHRRDAD